MSQLDGSGGAFAPDREPVLRETWLAVIGQLGARNLVIGGKSLGGRITSMCADKAGHYRLVHFRYLPKVQHMQDHKSCWT